FSAEVVQKVFLSRSMQVVPESGESQARGSVGELCRVFDRATPEVRVAAFSCWPIALKDQPQCIESLMTAGAGHMTAMLRQQARQSGFSQLRFIFGKFRNIGGRCRNVLSQDSSDDPVPAFDRAG